MIETKVAYLEARTGLSPPLIMPDMISQQSSEEEVDDILDDDDFEFIEGSFEGGSFEGISPAEQTVDTCSHCGKSLKSHSAKFCMHCGAEVKRDVEQKSIGSKSGDLDGGMQAKRSP